MERVALTGWSDSERRAEDGAIASSQHAITSRPVVEQSPEGARRLGTTYWSEVERSTAGLVRQRQRSGALEIRLAGVGPALLRFGPPQFEVGDATTSATYPIIGGLLARRQVGSICFRQVTGESVELASLIEGFHPTLAARPGAPEWTGQLYKNVQARLHSHISRRYFLRLMREAPR